MSQHTISSLNRHRPHRMRSLQGKIALTKAHAACIKIAGLRFTEIFLVVLIAVSAAFAQQPPRQPTPNDTLKSPEVLADNRVIFRLYAPRASEVTIGGDWIGQGLGTGGSLEKNEQGVWSITIGPLPPDFYSYSFTVDGVRTLDPKNPFIKQGISSLDNMFFLPGEAAAFQDNQAVAHGELRENWYQSSTLGMQRRLHVYTPPGYDSGKGRYPVFYLLHGGGDEDSGWSSIGRAGFILDNLLTQKKARPMIIVMPNGSLPRPANLPPATPGVPPDPAVMVALQERFTSELLKDIVPFIEKSYRVLPGSANRAIAGLSMGGGQTLRAVTSNPDQFAWIGVWSMGVNPQATADFEKRAAAFLDNPDRVNKQIRLFSISCGEKDTLAFNGSKNLAEILKKRSIRHQLHITPGGHTWINWRQYLHDYAQLLFH